MKTLQLATCVVFKQKVENKKQEAVTPLTKESQRQDSKKLSTKIKLIKIKIIIRVNLTTKWLTMD